MPYISRYVYYSCTTLAFGCIIYSDREMTIPYSDKQVRITSGGIGKIYTTSTSGSVVQITECSFTSTRSYTDPYTGTKNNCTGGSCSVVGGQVTLNDGNFVNNYQPSATYTSYISQTDANTRALAAATVIFDANKQEQINSRGNCTYTFSSGSGSYTANFTKNNCASNCYANGTVAFSRTETGYSASSTVSCADAQSKANTAAYDTAFAYVNANGQANANANGSCCCFVPSPACFGCFRYGVREVNTCTGLYRNDYVTAVNSCECGQGCAGTNNDYYECVNTFQQDKLTRERYNCAPYNFTGVTNLQSCGCTNNQPDIRYLEPLEQTCIDCEYWYILRDFAVCSPTAGNYFAKGVNYGFNKPSTAPCGGASTYNNQIGVRCIGGTAYGVYERTSGCGQRYSLWTADYAVFLNSYTDDVGTAGFCG